VRLEILRAANAQEGKFEFGGFAGSFSSRTPGGKAAASVIQAEGGDGVK
jgi:hypothetical protein